MTQANLVDISDRSDLAFPCLAMDRQASVTLSEFIGGRLSHRSIMAPVDSTIMESVRANSVEITKESLIIDLFDGRLISLPLAWYPRLWYGDPDERTNFEIIGDGMYIHWPDLDEDLSVAGILAGRRSGESQQSLKRWLASRTVQ